MEMSLMFVVFGVFCAVYSLYLLVSDKDALWERQQRRFRAQGIVNRVRTPEWERAQNISGVIGIVGGIIAVIIALTVPMGSSRRANHAESETRWQVDGRDISDAEAERMGLKGLFEQETKK